MPRTVSSSPLHTAKLLAFNATLNGDDVAPFHGDCANPQIHLVRGVESKLLSRLRQWHDPASTVDHAEGWGHIGGYAPPHVRHTHVSVRCRRCQPCQDHRRRLWTARAIEEMKMAPRSWFVTLTFRPEVRFIMESRADNSTRRRRAERLCDLNSIDRYQAIAAVTGQEVTRWLKRVRKVSKAKLRYLLVAEAHNDGFPHYHLLLHEISGSATKRQIQSAWDRNGFSHCRLIDTRSGNEAYYACKYLNKGASTRVRSSVHYGQLRPEIISDAVASLQQAGEKLPVRKEGTKRVGL